MIDQLQDEDWIDVYTRVIFAEFTLFNANSNLFVSAQIVSELMATGGMIHKFEFKVWLSYIQQEGKTHHPRLDRKNQKATQASPKS